jgi:hypothetical protein
MNNVIKGRDAKRRRRMVALAAREKNLVVAVGSGIDTPWLTAYIERTRQEIATLKERIDGRS